MADAVWCEITVFEIKLGFSSDFTEDVSEAVFVVAVAVRLFKDVEEEGDGPIGPVTFASGVLSGECRT